MIKYYYSFINLSYIIIVRLISLYINTLLIYHTFILSCTSLTFIKVPFWPCFISTSPYYSIMDHSSAQYSSSPQMSMMSSSSAGATSASSKRANISTPTSAGSS